MHYLTFLNFLKYNLCCIFTSVFLKHISLHYSWIWYTVNKKNKYEGQYEKYNSVVEYDKFYDINEIQREDFAGPFFTGHVDIFFQCPTGSNNKIEMKTTQAKTTNVIHTVNSYADDIAHNKVW